MNVLYSTNYGPVKKGHVQKAVEMLENLGHKIEAYEYGRVIRMSNYENHPPRTSEAWRVEFETKSYIPFEDAEKLWDADILDVGGSLTFVSEYGELEWRES